MFSPMVAMASAIAVSTVTLPTLAALIFSTSAPTSSATCAIILTSPWNCSLRATKSVSELPPRTTASGPAVGAPVRPSAATRPAFFAAFDRPFLRNQSIAACMSPSFSASACLQSIMPTPVVSRRSLTIAAVIVAIVAYPLPVRVTAAALAASPPSSTSNCLNWEVGGRKDPASAFAAFGFAGHRLGLGHPAVGAAWQSDFFADLVRGIVVEFGQLPVMEDAEVVELLLDRAGYAGELLEIVGGAARPGQTLERRRLRRHRDFFADGMRRRADIDPGFALRARDAVDHGAGHQIAVQRDGAAGVVIAGHDISDALGVRIGIDDRGDRNIEPLGLLDRDVFHVGVDHEDHVGQTAHVLDAAQRTIELVALALQGQPLFLGVGVGIAGIEHLVEMPQPLDRTGNRLPVGQGPAEPARIDEILRRALGGFGDAVLRLPLGADEQDTAALGDGVADRLERVGQQRYGLGEIDDVDVVAGAENELCHFRIPAVGLVAKVNAGFKQLAHRKIRRRHRCISLVVSLGSVGANEPYGPVATGRPLRAMLPCEMARYIAGFPPE